MTLAICHPRHVGIGPDVIAIGYRLRMAKKQTRRSVSMSRPLFKRSEAEAERDGVSLSHWIALVVKAELDRRGRPLNVQTMHMSRRITDRIAATKAAQAARS